MFSAHSLARLGLRSWRLRLAFGFSLLLALSCWGNALTDHLGYGSALVGAVVGSLFAGLASSALVRAARAREASTSALSLAVGSLACALALSLLFLLVVALRGLWAPACTPSRGLLWFALLTLPGVALSALAGALFDAALPSRPRAVTALCVLLEPAFVLWSLVRFYRSPAVFAYDPFFGFYPGVYYDERIALDGALVTYRLGTLAWCAALALLFALAWDPEKRALTRARARSQKELCVLFALCAAAGLGVYLGGAALGHRADAREVAEALGGTARSRRCVVHYDRSLEPREARALAVECDFRLQRLERFFALGDTGPVTVFLFADTAQKRRWMGAADTYIAKPWRREIYLQREGSLGVLEHELAHVVTGALGRWPLYLSTWGRLLPLPGLVEGAAVAAAWEGESDASPHQWARAMLEERQLPAVRSLLGTGFLAHGAGTAYTAAGSFSRFLVERYGPRAYGRVYRDGDFLAAFGRGAEELEAQWHAFLRTVALPDRVRTRARTRFRRAALGARVCPHETAELLDRGVDALHDGALPAARDTLLAVLRNDPTDLAARVGLAEALARSGDLQGVQRALEDAERALGPAAVHRLRRRVGDALWRWRGPQDARPVYARVDAELFDEDEARTVELEQWALGLGPGEAPGEAREALQALLVGRGLHEPEPVSALGALWTAPSDAPLGVRALGVYLLARQLERRGNYSSLASLAGRSEPEALPTARARAEWTRLRAVGLSRAGQWDAATELWRALAQDSSRPQGARDVASVWLERVAWLRAHGGAEP